MIFDLRLEIIADSSLRALKELVRIVRFIAFESNSWLIIFNNHAKEREMTMQVLDVTLNAPMRAYESST
jgi:hypothetical protein